VVLDALGVKVQNIFEAQKQQKIDQKF